jgi:hypothetical protein
MSVNYYLEALTMTTTIQSMTTISFIVLTLSIGAVPALAITPRPDPPAFGIVGIVSSQTARLNVVCSIHDVNGAVSPPCHGDLMFHDAAGDVIRDQELSTPARPVHVPRDRLPEGRRLEPFHLQPVLNARARSARVRTGEKEPFRGPEAIGRLIARMA